MAFGARGGIASQLIFQKSKGNTRVKAWSKPTNPNTEAQQRQRNILKLAFDLLHWTHFNSIILDAWNLLANTTTKTLSGTNLFVSNCIKSYNANTAAMFAFDATSFGGSSLFIRAQRLQKPPWDPEEGYFQLWRAADNKDFQFCTETEWSPGGFYFYDVGFEGETWYYQLKKNGTQRMGTLKLTLQP